MIRKRILKAKQKRVRMKVLQLVNGRLAWGYKFVVVKEFPCLCIDSFDTSAELDEHILSLECPPLKAAMTLRLQEERKRDELERKRKHESDLAKWKEDRSRGPMQVLRRKFR